MSDADILAEPHRYLEKIDANALAAEIEELERRLKALRVLLRSARARQRPKPPPKVVLRDK